MGNEQSQLSEGATFGFQVLKSTSPDVPLEPWFDFICGINGRQIDDGDARLFQQELMHCAGRSVTLGMWNAKGQVLRNQVITVPKDSLLGVSLQWSPLLVTEDVWHILDVSPGSPADISGLLPYSDYIIGACSGVVKGESGLGALVDDHLNRPLNLYVYNHEYDITREISIIPRRGWGGEGALGCVLGYGALHRLPAPLIEPLDSPGEAMFDAAVVHNYSQQAPPFLPVTSASSSTQDFVPAQVMASSSEVDQPAPPMFNPSQAPHSVPVKKTASRFKNRPGLSQMQSIDYMDSYMQEEETKSKANDYATDDAALLSSQGRVISPHPRAMQPPPHVAGGPPPSRAKSLASPGAGQGDISQVEP